MLLLVVVASSDLFALHTRTPYHRPRARKIRKSSTHVRRLNWAPALRGSHESLLRQNEEIDRLQLPRIQTDSELLDLVERQELVALEDSRSVQVSPKIERTRRYCRPWTRDFVEDLAAAYYEKFRAPLQVTSAVRTVEQQAKLRRTNRNAAPIDGDTASSHLAGTTIDIGKRGMTRQQRKWLDEYVLPLQSEHIVEAAEERRQACYHIMVTDRYSIWRAERGLGMASAEPVSPSEALTPSILTSPARNSMLAPEGTTTSK